MNGIVEIQIISITISAIVNLYLQWSFSMKKRSSLWANKALGPFTVFIQPSSKKNNYWLQYES